MARKQTKTFRWTRAVTDQLLTALSARPATAIMSNPTIRLMKTRVEVGPDTVIGDLSECTFHGYASLVAPMTHLVSDPGNVRAVLNDADFVSTNPIVPPGEIAEGYYVTDDMNTVVYGGELFDEGVPFANHGDFLDLDVHLPLPHLADTGLPQ